MFSYPHYRSTSLTSNSQPAYGHYRALDKVVLWDPRGSLFRMSEVPLYPPWHYTNTVRLELSARTVCMPSVTQESTGAGVQCSCSRRSFNHRKTTVLSVRRFVQGRRAFVRLNEIGGCVSTLISLNVSIERF